MVSINCTDERRFAENVFCEWTTKETVDALKKANAKISLTKVSMASLEAKGGYWTCTVGKLEKFTHLRQLLESPDEMRKGNLTQDRACERLGQLLVDHTGVPIVLSGSNDPIPDF
jgi:hypothetical protein